ncbi:PEP-CTERM sorting domain-containing protein [Sphingomonas koreensis]|nr:PEP-CTERM sorting domain-containing protein [Sphingomonas koreensis]
MRYDRAMFDPPASGDQTASAFSAIVDPPVARHGVMMGRQPHRPVSVRHMVADMPDEYLPGDRHGFTSAPDDLVWFSSVVPPSPTALAIGGGVTGGVTLGDIGGGDFIGLPGGLLIGPPGSGTNPGNPPDDPGGTTPDPGPGAVPEPATWALMIIGIGAIGVMMRRRRASTERRYETRLEAAFG